MFHPRQPLLLREHGVWGLELEFLKGSLRPQPWYVAEMGFRKDTCLLHLSGPEKKDQLGQHQYLLVLARASGGNTSDLQL